MCQILYKKKSILTWKTQKYIIWPCSFLQEMFEEKITYFPFLKNNNLIFLSCVFIFCRRGRRHIILRKTHILPNILAKWSFLYVRCLFLHIKILSSARTMFIRFLIHVMLFVKFWDFHRVYVCYSLLRQNVIVYNYNYNTYRKISSSRDIRNST
jgi:hypothetical protein